MREGWISHIVFCLNNKYSFLSSVKIKKFLISVEESFNIFNQFASFFYFLIKASAWCSSFSFPLYLLPAASTLRCHRFILHGLFFLLTPMHYYGYFSIYPWSSSFFSISTICYRYWFLAICCDVCFKLTYIFSNYRWLYACKII